MRIPRSRGAVSGLLLMVLGAWGAIVPFIGPYFGVSLGSDETWNWTTGRLWLSVVPGVVAFVGGFLTLTSAHRAKAGFGAWMAILAGAWFAVGPTVSLLWNDGVSAAGEPLGGTNARVLELLVTHTALGVVIAVLGAFALGRLAVRSVRDVELAREAETAAATTPATAAAPADERFERRDEPADAPTRVIPATTGAPRTAPADSAAARVAPDDPGPSPAAAASSRPVPPREHSEDAPTRVDPPR